MTEDEMVGWHHWLNGHESESVSHSVMSNSLRLKDCSLLGSSLHGIFQARMLEWVAIPFSLDSSRPRARACISSIASGFFPAELPGKP